MLRYLPLVAKNCWRNRRRTMLTIMSIAASLSLLGILVAVYAAVYLSDTPPAQAMRLAVRNKVSLVFSMPESYTAKIRSVPGVVEVTTMQWFGGKYKDEKPENMFPRFAIEPDKIFTVYSEFRIPEEQKINFQKERTACVIGKQLEKKLNARIGDRITLQGDIFPITLELTVRGIFEGPEDDEVLYFHRKYLDESIQGRLKGEVGMYMILADSAESVPRIAAAIDDQFRNAPVQTKTESERAFQLGFVNALGNVKGFLLSICAAVTFTILLVSGNTMAMSVRERVREVGILKTLGFTREAILGIILGEALLLALIGGVLGLALASALCALVRQAPAFISQTKTLTIQPSVALACLALAGLIGVVSSFVPAWGAARTSIVEALRRND